MMGLRIFILLFFAVQAYALEIDEKLTLRIIGLSETRKTVLINRGVEDGIAQNDHAKFYVSSGVVARGVCIKTSPTRSVWSLYRLVNADFIRNEQVMKLKVTPAVKITKDESRMLVNDDTLSSRVKDPRDLGIPLADGADDLTFEQNRAQVLERGMEDSIATNLLSKNKEIYGMFSYSSFSEKASPDNNLSDFSSEVNSLLLRAGGEWFFSREDNWYTRFSFAASLTYERRTMMAYQGIVVKEDSNEFGFGINLFPFKRPSEVDTLLHYFNYTFSLGSSSSSYSTGAEAGIGSRSDDAVDGSVLANSFGYGMRYYTSGGYGARILLSYYLRGDTFADDSTGVGWIKTRVGPRVLMGLSKRF